MRICTRLLSLGTLLMQYSIVSVALLLWSVGAQAQQAPANQSAGAPTASPKSQRAEPMDEDDEDEERIEAEKEVRQEEHQRILGLLPNFNSTSIRNAPALSPGQKWHLAFKTATDPFTFLVAGIDGAISQGENDFPGYHQGWLGYGKRFGASYLDSFDGTIVGNAVLPILFREDPRYFRKGTGSFTSRLFYAVSTTIRAKSDSGRWVPNYANVVGNFVAGGISNLYYPASDRGFGLTVQRAFTVTAEGSFGAILVEFWPDISARIKKKHAQASGN